MRTENQMWTAIINDARHYDGSPHTLISLIEHFKEQGYQLTDVKDSAYENVFKLWGATHNIEKRIGTDVVLGDLNKNQSVCYGDGKTYYWLLTKK